MPLIDKIREQKLIELAKTRFDPDLKPAPKTYLYRMRRPRVQKFARTSSAGWPPTPMPRHTSIRRESKSFAFPFQASSIFGSVVFLFH